MSTPDRSPEEGLRDRFLEIALEERLGDDPPADLTDRVEAAMARREAETYRTGAEPTADPARVVELPVVDPDGARRRRRPWWLAAAAAAVLLAWLAVPTPEEDPAPVEPAASKDITGLVVDDAGTPVQGARVLLELGWTGCDAGHFTWWKGVEQRQTVTGDDGRYEFADLPPDAAGVLWVAHAGLFGSVRGRGEMKIRLQKPGSLRGRVTAPKKSYFKGMKVWFRGPYGLTHAKIPTVALAKDGTFTMDGLPGGPGEVVVQYHNWAVARKAVEIQPRKTVNAGRIRISGHTPQGPDPLVDATEVKMVDGKGKPFPRVNMWWRSPWMDGGMNADGDGIIRMVGGGVAIGPPPFVLILNSTTVDNKPHYGTLLRIRGKTATVQVRPCIRVNGTVRRGREPVADFSVLLRTADRAPRVYGGQVRAGRFDVTVPPGEHTLFVILPSGEVEERKVEVKEGEDPQILDVDLNR
jgi:hypothetical protein